MKPVGRLFEDAIEMENIISVCGGSPRGDELPQVAGLEDILIDVYSDMTNAPREVAAGMFHRQCMNDFETYEEVVH